MDPNFDRAGTWNLRLGQAIPAIPDLLVDHDLDWLAVQELGGKVRLLRRLVKPFGYRVRAAGDGDSAVIVRRRIPSSLPRRHWMGGVEWERKAGRPGLHPARVGMSTRIGRDKGYRVLPVHVPPKGADSQPLRRKARDAYMGRLEAALLQWARRGRDWIAVGDWNNAPDSLPVELLAYATDGRVAHAVRAGVDYAMFRGVSVSDVRVVPQRLGDHDPRVFTVTRPTPADKGPTTMKIVHASQRYTSLASTLAAAAARHRKRASIVTYTEVGGQERRQAVLADGWRGQFAADCGVTWDTEKWDLDEAHTVATDQRWTTKDGGPGRTLASPVVVLRARDGGALVIIAVVHLPAGVESLLGRGGVSRVAAHAAHARKVSRAVNRLRRDLRRSGNRGTVCVIVGDWNVNALARVGRAWLASTFPLWETVAPDRGTHGPRVIDFAKVRGADGRLMAQTLSAGDESDHRAILIRRNPTRAA
jgi:exonuclease III